MFDLISIGDTVVDTIIPLIDANILEKDGSNFLALPYSSKVPVGPSISVVGGNAANNAVGSARLGLKTAIYTNIGNKDQDEWDDRIIAKFKKEKVNTNYITETNKFPSGHNIVLDFKGERTILVHHQSWEYRLPDLDYARWIYLTSMSPSSTKSDVIQQIINYIERSGAKLAFQPGTFQIKLGSKGNNKLMALSELFVVNLEEAKVFLDFNPDEKIPVKKLLLKLCDLGPKIAVITDGINGSYGFDGGKYYHIEVFPAKLLEMTGCGDAYTTGLIAGLFNKQPFTEAMRWAAVNSASVCEQIGPQEGLLTYNQIKERLKDNSKIIAKEI